MFNFNTYAYAYGEPASTAVFKSSPEDFRVDEILSFKLSGAGEHQFLRIEKRGLNTEELVRDLAKALKKPMKTISYAGLKDREALTTQWLSVHCPSEEIVNASALQGRGWRVLESMRHLKKLKIGGLSANQFTIVLHDIDNHQAIDTRLDIIKSGGVPNYFGEQRFGHAGLNILKARDMLLNDVRVKDKFLRGIYYSAARSFLFNLILSERVLNQTWNNALSGDVMQLAGTHSIFTCDSPDEEINARIAHRDISPAAPLYGLGNERMTQDALESMQNALCNYTDWCDALQKHGLKRMYRAHILHASNLTWHLQQPNCLTLSFELVAGAYATSILRELVKTDRRDRY